MPEIRSHRVPFPENGFWPIYWMARGEGVIHLSLVVYERAFRLSIFTPGALCAQLNMRA